MYQQSCEEYKHRGKSSGSYWIDPDGSGPVTAFHVTCDMSGERAAPLPPPPHLELLLISQLETIFQLSVLSFNLYIRTALKPRVFRNLSSLFFRGKGLDHTEEQHVSSNPSDERTGKREGGAPGHVQRDRRTGMLAKFG